MIDPVAIEIAGFSIRWYGIAWMVSFLFVLYMPSFYVKKTKWALKWEEIVTNTLLVVMIGGRIGSVIISQPHQFYQDPLLIFRIWEGGMSFFGAVLSGGLYVHWYAKKHKIDFLELTDAGLIHVPVALGLVRVANFINGELWGRVTDQTWGFHFKRAGPLLRHPSQLYEAFFEGLVLWGILYWVAKNSNRKGLVSITFVLGYGIIRLLIECFYREPSYDLTYLMSTGQIFSSILIFFGLWLARKI